MKQENVLNAGERLSFGEKLRRFPAVQSKGAILLAVLCCSFLGLLFLEFCSYSESDLDINIPLSGVRVLGMIFAGFGYSKYSDLLGTMRFTISPAIAVLYLVGLLLILGAIILTVVFSFVKKKDAPWLCAVCFALALYFLVLVILMLCGELPVSDRTGNTVSFYRRFDLGIGALVAMLFCLFGGFLQWKLKLNTLRLVKKNWMMYLLLVIPTIYILIFLIYPILLQVVLSFKDYNHSGGVFGSDWNGFANFSAIFSDAKMLRVIFNTIWISFLRLVFGMIPAIFMAIFLFDMGHDRLRKVSQTIIYIPHFFSWVVIYGIAFAFLSNSGVVNGIIKACGGTPIDFLNRNDLLIPILILTDLWKEMGWGTILYLAALSGIDPSLYEAATVDGAGPLKKMAHITLPGITPIIVFMGIMSIGNILKAAGGEQILLFGTQIMDNALVIDTWVYWFGMLEGRYSISAAISFFQSAIGIVLVLGCNKLSNKFVGVGMW